MIIDTAKHFFFFLFDYNTLCCPLVTIVFDHLGNPCSYMETNCSEFNLGDVLDVVMNQNMILSQERGVKIICEPPTDVSSLHLYGDNMRLQQVLSEFLTNTLLFSCKESSVVFKATPRKERIGKGIHIVHLELR